jgi:histidinol-phosphate phosphatase family protein
VVWPDEPSRTPLAAVLFDRDGTLIEEVPYLGDPAHVAPMAGAREALLALRSAGLPIAVVFNQNGIAEGLVAEEQVQAVNDRVEELLGPIDLWLYCPHGPDDGCGCRKPAPGLIVRAAELLGTHPAACAMLGDLDVDMQAAAAAGARGMLVPNERTRRRDLASAPEVAPDLIAAARLLLAVSPQAPNPAARAT